MKRKCWKLDSMECSSIFDVGNCQML